MDYLQKRLLETLTESTSFVDSAIMQAILDGDESRALDLAIDSSSIFARNLLRSPDPGSALLAYLLSTHGPMVHSVSHAGYPMSVEVRFNKLGYEIKPSSDNHYGPQREKWGRVTGRFNTTPKDLAIALSAYQDYIFPGMESLYNLVNGVGMKGARFDWLPSVSKNADVAMAFNLFALIYGGDRLELAERYGDMSFSNVVEEALLYGDETEGHPAGGLMYLFPLWYGRHSSVVGYGNPGKGVTMRNGEMALPIHDKEHLRAFKKDIRSPEMERVSPGPNLKFTDSHVVVRY
jgi:hypothetical protein